MEIKVYDKNLNFIGIIDDFDTLSVQTSYRSANRLNLSIAKQKHNSKLISTDNFFVHKNCPYIVTYFKETLQTIEIQTIDVASYIMQNTICKYGVSTGTGYDVFTGDYESAIQHFIENNTDLITLGINYNRGDTATTRARFNVLQDLITELCIASGLGYECIFENKEFVLNVIQGKDISTNQSENSPVIFSEKFDNIRNLEFIYNIQQSKNVAIVAGQGEAAERAIVIVGTETGLKRREMFVDARDIEDDALLPQRGEEKLAEVREEISLAFDVVHENKSFIYERDYNVGDIVTVVSDYATMHTRILSATEDYSDKGYELKIEAGKEIPDLISLIKRDRKNTLTEVYR